MPLFDLRKLNATLPVPSVPRSSIDILVLGAKDDFIVVSYLISKHFMVDLPYFCVPIANFPCFVYLLNITTVAILQM